MSDAVRNPFIVAIDGPAGSGKSSVSRAVAGRLGYGYLDTGAAYRALAWHARDVGADLGDEASVIASLDSFDYEIGTEPDHYFVRVGGVDVTTAIRDPAVTGVVSLIARVPEVRVRLNLLFRRIAASTTLPGIVIEGRDITTVVAPDAPVRILLTADESVRMARRRAELTGADADAAGAALAKRDRVDSRVVDFMTAAPGVLTVDSTDLDFGQTVETITAVIDTVRVAR